MSRTAVYRCYDAAGQLLYVGMSSAPLLRLGSHQAKPWAAEIAHVTTEYHPSREAARAAETTAIIDESPAWNVMNGRRKTRVMVQLDDAHLVWLADLRRQAEARGFKLSAAEVFRQLLDYAMEANGATSTE